MEHSDNTPDVDSPEKGFGAVVVQRDSNGVLSTDQDFVAHEVPVALVFNGISHAVMLATPLDLDDFALGFSLSEGIIEKRSEIYEIEQIDHPKVGIEIHLTIAAASFIKLKERRRSLVGRTGCGLCGLESLSAFEAGIQLKPPSQDSFTLSRTALLRAFNQLKSVQAINAVTGSMHAAAWINCAGEVLLVREDLGRHNALDKLIGALMGQDVSRGCVIMTSRASYELVQKTARAGIPLLATISAPTSLAIRLAQNSGVTLVGFVRHTSMVAYAHPERLILAD